MPRARLEWGCSWVMQLLARSNDDDVGGEAKKSNASNAFKHAPASKLTVLIRPHRSMCAFAPCLLVCPRVVPPSLLRVSLFRRLLCQQLESPMSSKKKATPSSAVSSSSKHAESSGSRHVPCCFNHSILLLVMHTEISTETVTQRRRTRREKTEREESR